MRAVIRVRHYSIRTEDTYVDWVRRYILLHWRCHPIDMVVDGYSTLKFSSFFTACLTSPRIKMKVKVA
ncbi:phage integrase N-terminal SAM-like domain-containing protein [Methylobacillus sp. Pita2]|uniref:phage integrase N-terminal SAM-like domain-containing protein n=1 Tax=Methylobacillus sp. Pita2 TaxID=3383245 RepID=UPI0038B42B18